MKNFFKMRKLSNGGEDLRRQPSQMEKEILQTIEHHPDWAISKVAYSCGINYARSTEILKKLEDEGLVQKRENSITRNNFLRGRPATVYSIC